MRNILRVVLPVLVLLGFSTLQAQPGCPAVTTAANVTVPCGQTCVNLTANALGGASTTAYAVNPIAYAPPFSFTSGTAILVNTDDIWSSVINLPFNFCFYGNTFNSAIIGSNGCISFNTGNAGATNNWSIPAGGAPFTGETDMRNSIMAPWQDLDPTNAGQVIHYNVGGAAPCRYLEVAWSNCPMYGDPSSVNTAYCTTTAHQSQMAVLYETSNAIEIYIQEKDVPCNNGSNGGYWNNGWAIEGLMNGAGTAAITVPGRNATRWSATNDAYRFTAAGNATYTIAWFLGNTQIGTGSPFQVCPTVPTTYTAKATYTNCDNSTVTVQSNVFVGLAALTVSDSARPITCNNANNGAVFATFNSTSGILSYGWAPGGAGQTSLNNIGPGTYVFTVTDSAGCVQRDTEVLVNPAPLVVSVPNDTATSCSGVTNNGLLTATTTGGTSPYGYVWTGGATTNPVTGLSAGTYSVTATDNHGCTGTNSAQVVVKTSALVFATPQIKNVSCNGGSNGQIIAPLNGGSLPIVYTWSQGTGTTDTLSNLTAGTYTVTAVDANNCSATASFQVGQNSAVVVTVLNDTVNACSANANTGVLSATATGGTPGYTYVWTGGATTNPVTGLVGGTYSVTATDNLGCTATASANVVVNVTPLVLAQPRVTNVTCYGGSNGQIIDPLIGGTNPVTYTWSSGTAHGDTLSNLGAGIYFVTAVDANGCSASASATVSQPATAVTVSVANDTVTSCTGLTNIGTLTANVSGGTPAYGYSWTGGATTNPITGLSAGTYTVTVSDVFGCTATATANVVTKVSSLSITGVVSNPVCAGSKGQIVITVTGGVNPITYNWNPGSSTTDTLAGIGGGVYNVTATDANGCSASASFTVTQPAPMIVRVPTDTIISCTGATTNGTLTASTTGGTPGYTYVWSNNSSANPITGLSAGTYLVTATDRVGCTAAGSGIVLVIGNPVTFNAPQITNAGCAGSATGQIILNVSGGTPPITFTWSGGTTQNDTLRNLAGGTYNITASDAGGCSATASYTVTQSSAIVFGNPVITNVGCTGGTNGAVTVTATGGAGTITYLWSNGATGNSVTGLSAGSITVTATDANNCTASALYTVGQSAPVAIGTATVNGVSCSGNGSISVTATGGTGTLTYTWNPGGLTGSSISNLVAGGYTLTVSDVNGCSATAYYIVGHSTCGGCPAVNTNNNITIPCSQTCTQLLATAFSAAQTTTYTVGQIPFNPPFAFNTGTAILVATDDLWSGIINLPFNFCFWGVAHNRILVGSNGEVSFNTGNANGTNNWSIPGPVPFTNANTEPDQRNTIMAPWQDLDPTYHGHIYYNIAGTAPCRKFEVSWYDTPMFGDSGSVDNAYCDSTDHQTQMVVLYETTNAIDIYIKNKDVVCNDISGGTYWNGGLAIEGIVNPTMTQAITVPGRNATQWTAHNDAWRFTPAGAPNFTVQWFQNGNLISSADTVTVCPSVPTTYTVLATYTNCDNSQVIVGDSVFVTPGGSLTVNIDSTRNVLCGGDSTGAVYASYSAPGGTVTSFGWNTPAGANQTSLVNIPAGTYIFTVTTATGCTKSDTVVITGPTRVTVTVPNDTFHSCSVSNIGTLTATAGGGSPGYTYLWSTGATTNTISGLTPGTYRVTVTDSHGCTGSAVATVTQISGNIAFNAPQITNPTCTVLGSLIVGVTGGTAPITYTWSPTEPNTDTLHGLTAGTYSVTATDAGGCSVSAAYTLTSGSTVTIDSSRVRNITCNGAANGSIIVYASGGAPPLTYVWTPSEPNTDTLTGLSAGSYSVTVTDRFGCSASASYVITEPTPIANDSVVEVDVTCTASGSLLVVDTGGVAPLSYVWSGGQTTDSITNQPAGTYTLTVTDAHGCSITASYVIGTAPGAIVFGTPVIVNSTCHGDSTGSITVSATGGSAAITFVWNTGATTATISGLAPGTYTVTGSDGQGCSASASYTITQPAAITFGNPTIVNVHCNGDSTGSISLVTTGGTGTVSYVWGNGATGSSITTLTAGVYCVTATDSVGCSASICYNVSQPTPITIIGGSGTPITCNASGTLNIVVTGGVPGYTYNWSNGQTGDSIIVTSPGVITVTITDASGCSITLSHTVNAAIGSVAIGNPVITPITCNGANNGSITVTATDTAGGPITYVWGTGASTATISGLSTGNYCVTATDSLGCSASACYLLTQPAAITFGPAVIVSPSCNGGSNGSITVNATGGTGAITFSWGNITGPKDSLLAQGTYTVTATDSSGCTATASYTVSQPAAIAFGNSTVTNITCFGANNGSITLAVTGGTGAYTYSWTGGATTNAISGLSAGNYCVTVTDSAGCSASTCYNIVEPAQIVVNSSVIHEASCVTGGSVVLGVTGGTGTLVFHWSSNASTTDSAGNVAAGNINVTITDANGCSITATYVVPAAANTVSIDSAHTVNVSCNGGNNGSVTVFASGGIGSLHYGWSVAGTTSVISGLTAGNYNVTVTDSLGCTATAQYTVTQPGAIVVDSVTSTQVTCTTAGSLTVYAHGGTGVLTYGWPSSGNTTNTLGGLNAGSYTITITDANGCSITTTGTVTTAPNVISLAFNNTQPTCFGLSNGSITVTASGGSGTGYTYVWANGPSTAVNSGLAAGNYCVTVHDSNGCSVAQCDSLHQPALLVITGFITNQATCTTLGSITVQTSGGTNPDTYSWTGGSTTNPVTGLVGGSQETVIVTDHNGCTASASDTLAPAPAPLTIVNPIVVNNLCFNGAAGSISVSTAGGTGGTVLFHWSNNASTATITGLTAGTYYVTASNATGGCFVVDSFTITQPGAYSASVVGSSLVCPGANDSLAVLVTGGTPTYTYSWNPGGQTTQAIVVSGLTTAGTTETVTVTDNVGCTTTASLTVRAAAQIVAHDTVIPHPCAGGGDVIITATGGAGSLTYNYTPNGSSNGTGVFNGVASGSYSYTVADSIGCSVNGSFVVPASVPADVYTSHADSTSCFAFSDGSITVIEDSLQNAPFTYSINGGAFQSSNVFDSLAAGTYQIIVHNNFGCADTLLDTVGQPAQLAVSFSPDTILGIANYANQLSPNIVNFINPVYSWTSTVPGILSCTTCATPTANSSQPSWIYVTVSDSLNPRCNVSDSLLLLLKGPLVMPDAFTPNGDGKNDYFGPVSHTYVIVKEFHIYNRWGQLVHNSTSPWDGKFDGKEQPSGTYIYYIEGQYEDPANPGNLLTGKQQGAVTLLR